MNIPKGEKDYILVDYTEKRHRKTSLETIRAGFNEFYKENKRYPKSAEISVYKYLPNLKHIDRNFGGLRQLRKDLGLKIISFNEGKERRKTALMCNKRAEDYSREMRKYLEDLFSPICVHIEHAMTDITNNRCDYLLFIKNKKQAAIDLFYPVTKNTFTGCINIKQIKYNKASDYKSMNILSLSA